MELTFKSEKKKKAVRYLSFLPKHLRSIGMLSLTINFISLFLAGFFYPRLQKEIPLFYSLPSDQQLTKKEYIFILPLIAAIINLFHLLIAYLEKDINQNILKMFIQITLLMQILVLAILLRIIIIVF